MKITLQDLIIPISLQVFESQEETLLLGTDWFNKSKAKLDFANNTLYVKYLGKQVTINATHVSNNMPAQELEEFTDEDEWIDELEEIMKKFKPSVLMNMFLRMMIYFTILGLNITLLYI